MPKTPSPEGSPVTLPKRYRLPGIEREGIAQLSLLETALWPLQGGKLHSNTFETQYAFTTPAGRKTATVTVRSPLGLQPIDEYVLWGLLGATLRWKDPDPLLLATPYWMLKHLGLATGGSQYAELRDSLLRLALTSYQNTAFYDPNAREHQYAAFQFLSILLPTLGGVGETVDNERSWRIEWNPAFFRFCQGTGGNLLFDLDRYRMLTPAARRLFLKLKDRFWRENRVFLNVDELTIHGLGFSALRPLKNRKLALKKCMRELLEHRIIMLGRGQTDLEELFLRRGKGSYVVVFYEGEYFRLPPAQRTITQQNALSDDPLHEPLRRIGVDDPAIRRLFNNYSHSLLQQWVRITDAAMHEHPRSFGGFRTSAAAFLIDGVQNGRTPPDWFHAHEKEQQRKRWESQHSATVAEEQELRLAYQRERTAAFQEFLTSAEGRTAYDHCYASLLILYKTTEPHRPAEAAHEAARARIERVDFRFPDFGEWVLKRPSPQRTLFS